MGQQKHGHHAHVSLFGTVNVFNGDTILHRVETANVTIFLDFLRIVKKHYPDK
jgi:hypothetical protein